MRQEDHTKNSSAEENINERNNQPDSDTAQNEDEIGITSNASGEIILKSGQI